MKRLNKWLWELREDEVKAQLRRAWHWVTDQVHHTPHRELMDDLNEDVRAHWASSPDFDRPHPTPSRDGWNIW